MRFSRVLFAVALLCGCSDYGSEPVVAPPPPPPAPVEPGNRQLLIFMADVPFESLGERRAAQALVTDLSGHVVDAPAITWTSSNPGVAIVSGTAAIGTITAVDDGVTTIFATGGGLQGAITVRVRRVIASVEIINELPVLGPGQTTQLRALALDAFGHVIVGVKNFVFTSSNSNSVSISATGQVTGLLPKGPVTVLASTARDGVAVSGSAVLTVFAPATFDFASVMTGEDARPAPVLTGGQGEAFFRTLQFNRISYLVVWAGLTGPATNVWIRQSGATPEENRILVELAPPTSNTNWGTVNASILPTDIRALPGQPPISMDSLASLFRRGKAFVEVSTFRFPSGEVRGLVEGPLRFPSPEIPGLVKGAIK